MSVLVMHDGSVVAVVGWRSRFVSLFVGCSLLFVALLAVLLFCFWCWSVCSVLVWWPVPWGCSFCCSVSLFDCGIVAFVLVCM